MIITILEVNKRWTQILWDLNLIHLLGGGSFFKKNKINAKLGIGHGRGLCNKQALKLNPSLRKVQRAGVPGVCLIQRGFIVRRNLT